MSEPLRVGILGSGRWANVHRETLAAAGAELAGVLTGRSERAREVELEWGVAATTDLATLLAMDLEAVIVSTPNDLHAPQALAAIAAGKHVLIEKPMAISEPDARAILSAARGARTVVAVGHEMRAFDWCARVHDAIASGRLGEPLHLKLDLWRRPYRAGSGGWKSDPARVGSSILEEPVHYLDLARWWLGEATEVSAWASSRPGRSAWFENLDARLRFAPASDGTPRWGLVTRSIAAAGHHVDLTLVGSEASLRGRWHGSMDLDPQPRVALTLHPPGGEPEELPVAARCGHAFDVVRQTQAFVAAIRSGSAPLASALDGYAAVNLCLRVEDSLRLGAPVEVPPLP